MRELSKTKVDQLGDRLRKQVAEDDLRLLDAYRRSFAGAYEVVFTTVRAGVGRDPTGRVAKSTSSIVEKLQRESIRLSQIQDIAGCRVVVDDIPAQDAALESLRLQFETVHVADRRVRPSHGYRAVHIIAFVDGASVEIQLRTVLQHLWAELSERLSDSRDPAIKYGGGPAQLQQMLVGLSTEVGLIEDVERRANVFGLHPAMAELRNEMRSRLLASIGIVEQFGDRGT